MEDQGQTWQTELFLSLPTVFLLEKVRAFSLRNCQPSFSMALLGPHLALLVNSSRSKFLKYLSMDMIKVNVWD